MGYDDNDESMGGRVYVRVISFEEFILTKFFCFTESLALPTQGPRRFGEQVAGSSREHSTSTPERRDDVVRDGLVHPDAAAPS